MTLASYSSRILFLRHHGHELLEADPSVAVHVGLPHHDVDLGLGQRHLVLLHGLLQLLGRDEAVVVGVEVVERFPEIFLEGGLLHLVLHQHQELFELDCPVAVNVHGLKVGADVKVFRH